MFICLSYFPIFCLYLSISFPRFSTSFYRCDSAQTRLAGWGPSPQLLFKVAQLAPWALVAVPMDSSSLGMV